jgi:hypothetical protein
MGPDPRTEFIDAALWHGSLERAEAILADHPEIAGGDIHVAAILGDDAAIRRFLEADPSTASAKGGPRGWDALTHLCFSKYLRLDRGRSDAFVRAATALLDAGANANTGFENPNHGPTRVMESVPRVGVESPAKLGWGGCPRQPTRSPTTHCSALSNGRQGLLNPPENTLENTR